MPVSDHLTGIKVVLVEDHVDSRRALGPSAGGTVPFITFSSRTRPEERAKTRQAGFALHLGKPAMPEELVQAILKVVTGRPKGSAPP